ncbi:acidic mammalian chitinase-like [Amphiura filiformis]|uniref:acidic mammalian chitinase-like n=1 Tax=Amphiura filiformis TaxID=82378 RepID=UPI003B2283E1
MYCFTALVALVVSVSAYQSNNDVSVQQAPRLVCYHTNWAFMRAEPMNFTPDQIDPNMCTHLIYSFAKINPTSFLLEPYEPTDTEGPNYYKVFNDLKMLNSALKTLLAVGGWTHASEGFTDMVLTPESRKIFIDDSIAYLRRYGFDGLDLDWEYPTQRGGKPSDKAGYTALCKELREAYQAEADATGQERMLVTMAIPGGEWTINDGYEIEPLGRYLDFANLMSYDLHGSWEWEKHHHTPLYEGPGDSSTDKMLVLDYVINKWINGGMPAHKLIMGLGMYGRTWKRGSSCAINTPGEGAGPAGQWTGEPGFWAYYEVCGKLKSGMAYTWDSARKVGFGCNTETNEWVGYDDERSLDEKISFMKSNGLGGGMIWALDLDDYTGTQCDAGPWPLMTVVKKESSKVVI